MREILFRGKRPNGEWAYGWYYPLRHDKDTITHYIVENPLPVLRGVKESVVDPATIGQFTGLCDKNGKKIFEGDIIERRLLPTKRICTKSIVKYAEPHAAFAINDINGNVIEDYLDSILRMNFEN